MSYVPRDLDSLESMLCQIVATLVQNSSAKGQIKVNDLIRLNVQGEHSILHLNFNSIEHFLSNQPRKSKVIVAESIINISESCKKIIQGWISDQPRDGIPVIVTIFDIEGKWFVKVFYVQFRMSGGKRIIEPSFAQTEYLSSGVFYGIYRPNEYKKVLCNKCLKDAKTFCCKRCKFTRYCSKKCMKSDYNHKSECRRLRDINRELVSYRT